MDYQFWIYLVLLLIYLVSRAMKKTQQAGDVEERQPRTGTESERRAAAERPMTFEDLLREITEGKQASKPAPPVRREMREPEVVDYDEQVGEEVQDLEEVDYDYRKKDKLYDTYEEAKRMAFNRPSLEESLSLRGTQVEFGKFKVFEKEERPDLLNAYTKDLQDPEGLKKAVVLAEILGRKFEY